MAGKPVRESAPLDRAMTVEALMRAYPGTISVMIRWRMLCIGCPVSGFHTIAQACAAHGYEEAGFVAELAEAIAAPRRRGARPARAYLPR